MFLLYDVEVSYSHLSKYGLRFYYFRNILDSDLVPHIIRDFLCFCYMM